MLRKKSEYRQPMYIDQWLTEELYYWFAHSPDVPMPLEVLYSLISSGNVVCHEGPTRPLAIESGRWSKEFKELRKTQKLTTVNWRWHELAENLDVWDRVVLETNSYDIKEASCAIAFCRSSQIPYRASSYAASYIQEAVASASELTSHHRGTSVEDNTARMNQLVHWIFQVEVPELEVRSGPQRVDYFQKLAPQFAEFLPIDILEESIRNSVFISPPELLDLLNQEKAIEALREAVKELSKLRLCEPHVRSLIREKWDQLVGRLEVADLVFTGIDMALIPLGPFGVVSRLAQFAVNHYIEEASNWLLTLSSFNRQLRRSSRDNSNST